MKYHAISFIYSYQCSNECSICCFKCSPYQKERLDYTVVNNVIKNLPDEIRVIGITGGECFLFYDEIKKILQVIKQQNLQSTLTTNCYWATNDSIVRERLNELKQYNLRSIKISIDEYHMQHIPIENVKRFLRIGKEIGIKIVVGCTVLKNSKKMSEILKAFDDEMVSIHFVQHYCYPLGNAKKIASEYFYKYENIFTDCFDGGSLIVSPNGVAYPCGSMCSMIPSRRIGNIYNDSIRKIIEKAEQDKINNFLYYNGTRNLVKHMRKRYPEIQNKQFVDGCHACYEIMKTYSAEQLLEIIKEIEGEEENV